MPALNVHDRVIFKKNGRKWHFGKVVGNVNDRSYIIADNLGNHFRHNRRFIAKTNNNDFNSSEFLCEENIQNIVIILMTLMKSILFHHQIKTMRM